MHRPRLHSPHLPNFWCPSRQTAHPCLAFVSNAQGGGRKRPGGASAVQFWISPWSRASCSLTWRGCFCRTKATRPVCPGAELLCVVVSYYVVPTLPCAVCTPTLPDGCGPSESAQGSPGTRPFPGKASRTDVWTDLNLIKEQVLGRRRRNTPFPLQVTLSHSLATSIADPRYCFLSGLRGCLCGLLAGDFRWGGAKGDWGAPPGA